MAKGYADKVLQKAFKKAAKNKQIVYTDLTGHTYYQCPGAYNDELHRALGINMARAGLFAKKETGQKLNDIAADFRLLNTTLMRMMDDLKGDRELIEFDYDKATNIIKTAKTIKEDEEFMGSVADPNFTSRLDLFVSETVYMIHWAFYMEQTYRIREQTIRAKTTIRDDEDNLIMGLEGEELECFVLTQKIRHMLLKLLLRQPADSKYVKNLSDRLYILDAIAEKLLNGEG